MRGHHKWGDIALAVFTVCAVLYWVYVMAGM